MMQINGTIPANMAVDEITVSQTATEHSFNHSLGQTPDLVFLLAKSEPQNTGNVYPAFFDGWIISPSATYVDYKRIITNYKTPSSTAWDYTATNYGWQADAQSVQLKMSGAERLPKGTYYLITYKFS